MTCTNDRLTSFGMDVFRLGLMGLGPALVLGGLSACHLMAEFDESKIERTEQKTYLFPQQSDVKGWDLLVVVDTRDPSDMEAVREYVVAMVQKLADSQTDPEILYDQGGMGADDLYNPSPQDNPIHVGFVSSDIGVGADATTWGMEVVPPGGCSWVGGQGRLVHPPLARPGEAGPLHPFLVIHGRGVANFLDITGNRLDIPLPEAVDAFWGAVSAQPSTCPFQQPLAAANLALEYNLYNLGFFRDDAALGVIVLTVDDDCSISDPSTFLFDYEANLPRMTSPFDCFANGVTCDGPELITDPGMKQNCRDLDYGIIEEPGTRDGGAHIFVQGFMSPAAEYAGRLVTLKNDRPVLLLAIAGPEGPVVVGREGQTPVLEVAQTCGPFMTHPGIRLKAFGEALGMPLYSPVCTGDFTPLVQMAIDMYQNQAVQRCFPDVVTDQDAATPGVQAACAVEFVNEPGTAQEEVLMTLDSCTSENVTTPYCWNLWEDPNCATGLMLAIENYWGVSSEELVMGEVVRAVCTMEKK